MNFELIPDIGPGPLKFGMSPEAVKAILGPPSEVLEIEAGQIVELRDGINLGYSGEQPVLEEAVFSSNTSLLFQGLNLLSTANPIDILRKYDATPYLWVGNVIFLKLGIRVTGFHDNDKSQLAISVVRRGHWDNYIADFEGILE